MSKTLTSTERREMRAAVNDWRNTPRSMARQQAVLSERGIRLDYDMDGRGSGLADLGHDLRAFGELDDGL